MALVVHWEFADARLASAHSAAPDEVIAGVSTRIGGPIGSLVYVAWDQGVDAERYVEFSFEDGVWMQSPVTVRAIGHHEQVLVGVRYREEVVCRVVVLATDRPVLSVDQTITTAVIDPDFPEPTVVEGDASRWDVDMPYVFATMNEDGSDFGGPWWAFVMDRQGRVVWALQTDRDFVSMHSRVALDGRAWLIDQNSFWTRYDDGEDSRVRASTRSMNPRPPCAKSPTGAPQKRIGCMARTWAKPIGWAPGTCFTTTGAPRACASSPRTATSSGTSSGRAAERLAEAHLWPNYGGLSRRIERRAHEPPRPPRRHPAAATHARLPNACIGGTRNRRVSPCTIRRRWSRPPHTARSR